MYRTNGGVSDRWILPVQLRRICLHLRVIERRVERQVGGCGYAAGGVRHHQRQAQRANLLTETQQCLSLRAWPRIVEAAEHARIEAAGSGCISFEVAEDENP